jgi:hypothetical protein
LAGDLKKAMKDGKPIIIEVLPSVRINFNITFMCFSKPTTQKTTLPYYDLLYLSPCPLFSSVFHGGKHGWIEDARHADTISRVPKVFLHGYCAHESMIIQK